ncbi:manganese efflux pump [Priestia megaterium]|nr:manganese efflux pump [Priestia megaterium]RCX27726.1 putative sporulation protein YtaF [Bacillus sp. AG236]MCU7737600.1 manganese efflux pump [Priestia megaterium]MED4059213.1 manganese efflux pump [Priestia megaterium]PFK96247.1 sporulation membrane protein YtaF [Priestia megaterium]PGY50372.1 sporulation membrane protein YtaF [Priestia megaterium]
MEWLFIVGFALSSSIDNFGVGISYGVRKVRIKWLSNLLIAAICFLFSMVGITFGRWISTILPGVFHVIVAVVLLTLIGIRIILLVGSQRNNGSDELDSSGQENVRYIGWIESSVLGVALSANALTNGLGAGLLGLSPLAISLTSAFGSFITVWLGVMVGKKAANVQIGKFTLSQFGTLISGITILIVAFTQIF